MLNFDCSVVYQITVCTLKPQCKTNFTCKIVVDILFLLVWYNTQIMSNKEQKCPVKWAFKIQWLLTILFLDQFSNGLQAQTI